MLLSQKMMVINKNAYAQPTRRSPCDLIVEKFCTPGVLPKKLGGGVRLASSRLSVVGDEHRLVSIPLVFLWPKSAIFATLFMIQRKMWYPIYDLCGWLGCPGHLEELSSMDLVMMKMQFPLAKKHTQFATRMQNPYPINEQNGGKTIPFRDFIAFV